MNTHSLMKPYHGRVDYAEIAKYAVQLAKQGNDEDSILSLVNERFGNPFLKMNETNKPFTVFGRHLIEDSAIKQMELAMSIPVAISGSLMPDAHLGYALPIGGVIALENAISPSFVGYDISCMVMLSIFDIEVSSFMDSIDYFANVLRESTSFGVGASNKWNHEHPVMNMSEWGDIEALKRVKELAQLQLGSSGGGNHFADLVLIESDNPKIGMLTHSGSRGAGHKVATHYVKQAERYTSGIASNVPNGYEWLAVDHELGQEYLMAMNVLGDYAYANHSLMHQTFSTSIGFQPTKQIMNRHNFVWDRDGLFIHRKGATPANNGQLGLIPGSSGSASYIVSGLGNKDSLYSSSHGAGRVGSRTQAKKNHNELEFQKRMSNLGTKHFGLAQDETYQAYKDIEAVMKVQNGVLVQTIAKLKPLVVLMSGESDDGD